MKKILLTMCGIGCLTTAAVAGEWPPEMLQPPGYPWEELWPTNNASNVKDLIMGEAFRDQQAAYYAFGREAHPNGERHNFAYNVTFRSDLPGGSIAERIGQMEIGEVESFRSKGISGKVKLIGTQDVGPHTCRQTEWTMTKVSGAIIGNAAGKVSKYDLFCLNPSDGRWFRVQRSV